MTFYDHLIRDVMVNPPGWTRWTVPGAIWRIPVTEKVLFLTFDDGPLPGLTDWVLDELKKRDARATFFCRGDRVAEHPTLLARILAEGHDAGNHGYRHLNGFFTGNRRYLGDILEAGKLINTGWLRPPYGRIRPLVAKTLRKEYTIIMWDVLSLDYHKRFNPLEVAANVIAHAGPGSIIVFHDNRKAERNLKEALPLVLGHYADEGYKFLPLRAILT